MVDTCKFLLRSLQTMYSTTIGGVGFLQARRQPESVQVGTLPAGGTAPGVVVHTKVLYFTPADNTKPQNPSKPRYVRPKRSQSLSKCTAER